MVFCSIVRPFWSWTYDCFMILVTAEISTCDSSASTAVSSSCSWICQPSQILQKFIQILNSSNDFCEICYSSLMLNYVKLKNMTFSTVFKQQLVSHVVRSMPHSSQQIFPWLSVILRYPRHPCPSSSHRFLDHQMMASFWSFLLSAWVSRVSPGPPWPKMFAPAANDQYRFMHFRTEILTPSTTSRP